jgi:4-amino-4-deoxy-L-arabinose transferase-like glycosyltransferase
VGQQLRIVNGTVNKLTIGLAWDLAGYSVTDLNQPWYWGMPDEWEWNKTNRGMPSDDLLRYARLPSTLFTALSVVIIFIITWVISHNHAASSVSALIYATYPPVLLNGRRAMMEGSFLFFSALVILAALMLGRATNTRRQIGWAVLLGISSGLAVASKHTAVIPVAVAFLAVGVLSYSWTHTYFLPLILAGIVGLVVFLALNPAWWSNPLGVARQVLDNRRDLVEQQIEGAKITGDYYDHAGKRVEKLADQGLFARAQYYEVPYWKDFIADQITDYENSGLAGRSDSLIWAGLLLISLCIGIITLITRWRDGSAWIGLVWLGGTAFALLVLVPLDWQRYYLPLYAPLAVVGGIGVSSIITQISRVLSHSARITNWPRS